MKGEYTNSNWPQIKTGLKYCFLFLAAFSIVALVGSSLHPGWLLLASPIAVGGAAYAASDNDKWFYWGVAAGLGFAIAILVFGI